MISGNNYLGLGNFLRTRVPGTQLTSLTPCYAYDVLMLTRIAQLNVICGINVRDSTGTISGTVSARNNVGSVRSRNIFCSKARICDLPYKKLVCGPRGKVGSSKGESEHSR